MRQLEKRIADNALEQENVVARKCEVGQELRRLAEAIAKGIPAHSLKKAIAERELELQALEDRSQFVGTPSLRIDPGNIRNFIAQELYDLVSILNEDKVCAKNELAKRLELVRMTPCPGPHGVHFYSGDSKWKIVHTAEREGEMLGFPHHLLISKHPDDADERKGAATTCGVRMVAGGGFEPPTFGL